MRLKNFLKDKRLTISLLVFGIVTIEIFLTIYPIGNFIKIYIPIVILGLYFISIMVEYFRKKAFYQKINQTLNQLEEKYLVTELIKEPNFIEGKELKEVLQEINKSMLEHVNQYKYLTEDYKNILNYGFMKLNYH